MPATTNPTPTQKVTMNTFNATVMAGNTTAAYERVAKHLRKLDLFEPTGRVSIRDERHGLYDVEVVNYGGDVNDAWVVLTSYGISPSKDLGSRWQTVAGIGR
jgi:hypothetical protein